MMTDSVDTKKKQEEGEEVMALVPPYYRRLATSLLDTVRDTQVLGDPSQDNFLKGLGGLGLVFLLLGQGGHLLRTIVGVAYPGYRSLKALLTDDKTDDMLWLRYWVVLAVFTVLELGLDLVLSWAPGYLLAKLAFLAWCMAPVQDNGSNVIFSQLVLPLYKKHQVQIEGLEKSAKEKAEKMIQEAMETSKDI